MSDQRYSMNGTNLIPMTVAHTLRNDQQFRLHLGNMHICLPVNVCRLGEMPMMLPLEDKR